MLKRIDIIDAYVEHVLDSMDMDALLDYAREKLYENYEEMKEDEFIEMVKDCAPEIIDIE